MADAIRAARALVISRPRDPAAWGELAMVFHAQSFIGPAKQCYTEAERLDPLSPYWPYLTGFYNQQDGDPKDAIECFRRAAGRAGAEPTANLRLGEAVLEQGQLDEADAKFRAALDNASVEPRAHLGQARVALAREDARTCVEHLGKCLQRTGDFPDACALLAQAHHALGEHDLAKEARDRAGQRKEPFAWSAPYVAQLEARRT